MAANAPENVRRLLAWIKKNPEPKAEILRYTPDMVSVPRPRVLKLVTL